MLLPFVENIIISDKASWYIPSCIVLSVILGDSVTQTKLGKKTQTFVFTHSGMHNKYLCLNTFLEVLVRKHLSFKYLFSST